eukprot:jgi/Psemu1/236268/estExt_Genewise1.C_430030
MEMDSIRFDSTRLDSIRFGSIALNIYSILMTHNDSDGCSTIHDQTPEQRSTPHTITLYTNIYSYRARKLNAILLANFPVEFLSALSETPSYVLHSNN